MKIPLTKTYFDKEEEKAVIQVLRSGWVLQGPKVLEFEKEVKNYLNAKYVVAVSSGTAALFLSLIALGVKEGDEVILPSLTFISCANVIVQLGAKPVFADINPDTFNIDPEDVHKKITDKTRVIMAVDQIGLPADLSRLKKITKSNGIFLLEDAACALGSEYRGKKVGTITDVTCFSLHPRKNITTGEGGLIVTNNKKWYETALVLRNHGIGLDGSYQNIGYNFRMTDIQASIGISQLMKIDRLIRKRNILAQRYNKKLSEIKCLKIPSLANKIKTNWQSYMIRLNPDINRGKLIKVLNDKNIVTKEGIPPIHIQPPYKELFGKIELPETEKASNETLFLPLYPQMTFKEQDYVISSLKEILC